MIRVNLLNDISSGGGGVSSEGGGLRGFLKRLSEGSDTSSASGNIDVVWKVVLLILPVIIIFGYRQIAISRAEAEKTRLTTEAAQLDTKLRSYDISLKDIEKFEEEKKKLDAQLLIIKNLSRARLRSVKSLDAMQSLIPNKAWLDILRIKDSKVEIVGFASDDVVVSDYMQQLGASIYFHNIVLTESVEATSVEGPVKKFTMKCDLENL
jgi:type IV pilus assembly protein PilN